MGKNNMKWNMNVRDLTTIGICIAIAVILGKFLGVIHRVIPFSRGIVNAPFYSFLITLILYRVRKPGAMTLFALGYGLIMARFSIFAAGSIIIGGILADIITFTIIRNYDSNLKISLCAPLYSAGGIIGTFIVVTYLTESALYNFEGSLALIMSLITVYIAGLVGSLSAMKIFQKRLFFRNKEIEHRV